MEPNPLTSKNTISEEHRARYRDHYAARHLRAVNSRASVWLPRVEELGHAMRARTILDYGSGPSRGISGFTSFAVRDYDPGVPGIDGPPAPADLVVSIHALEHVERDRLTAVIEHMKSLALRGLLIVVSCEPSTKVLPDGTPWHTIVEPPQWWRRRHDLQGFEIVPTIKAEGREFAAFLPRMPFIKVDAVLPTHQVSR